MAAKASKKRKASELEDHSTTKNNAKKIKGKKSTKKGSAPEPIPDPPFKVVCPFNGQADYKIGSERIRLGKDFEFEYGVKSFDPDTQWEDVKAYKHVKRK